MTSAEPRLRFAVDSDSQTSGSDGAGDDPDAPPRRVVEDALEVIEQAGGIVGAIVADVDDGRLFLALVDEIERVVERLRVSLEPEQRCGAAPGGRGTRTTRLSPGGT